MDAFDYSVKRSFSPTIDDWSIVAPVALIRFYGVGTASDDPSAAIKDFGTIEVAEMLTL